MIGREREKRGASDLAIGREQRKRFDERSNSVSRDPSEAVMAEPAWPQAPTGAHSRDQGRASTRSGARPKCARFLYGLAFGLSRSLAIPSRDVADGDGHCKGAASQGAECLSCPPADACGYGAQLLGADRDW
jgi:hypothetical protein